MEDAPGELAKAHEALGAVWRRLPSGELVVGSYGSLESEVAALRGGVAVVDRLWPSALELAGDDRQRFLNGLTTLDVKALVPGAGGYGFFTDGKGRILADVVVEAHADRLRLELPPGRATAIAEHLGKYIIADRVEVGPPLAGRVLLVAGPGAAAWLAERLTGEVPLELWAHSECTLGETAVRIARRGNVGVEAWSLTADEGACAALLRDAGAVAAGYDALDVVRVEQGLPLWGIDYDAENLPQETGLEDAVSYTKGCYLGQEVVARIHYRGQVNRVPRGVLPSRAVAVGAQLEHDGRAAGRLTSLVDSPRLGRRLGLALLHRRAAEPGTRLAVEGGGEAEVVDLPVEEE